MKVSQAGLERLVVGSDIARLESLPASPMNAEYSVTADATTTRITPARTTARVSSAAFTVVLPSRFRPNLDHGCFRYVCYAFLMKHVSRAVAIRLLSAESIATS
jgi:hypothetical protein